MVHLGREKDIAKNVQGRQVFHFHVQDLGLKPLVSVFSFLCELIYGTPSGASSERGASGATVVVWIGSEKYQDEPREGWPLSPLSDSKPTLLTFSVFLQLVAADLFDLFCSSSIFGLLVTKGDYPFVPTLKRH